MNAIDALYLVGLAGVAGYVLVGRVPSVLHTPLLAGSNFIHGIVLVGAILAFAVAESAAAGIAGALAVALAAANVVGGLVLTERVFALFERSRRGAPAKRAGSAADDPGGASGEAR